MGFLDFLSGFLSQAGGVGAQIQAVFAFLVFYINALFSFLYKVLVDVANFLYDILKRVGKFFRYIWDKFFYGIFNRLFQKLLVFHDWLEAHLKPIIQFLQRVRAYIDRFFKLYIKPFLNLIQHIRRVLLIMRLLHIKFAQQLDSRLLRLEVKVAGVFIQARAVLNNIIDVVNILADPTRLLRHPTLVISIRRSLPAIVRAITGQSIDVIWPSPKKRLLDDGTGLDNTLAFGFTENVEGAGDADVADLPPLDYFVERYRKCGDHDTLFEKLHDTLELILIDLRSPQTVLEKVEDVASDLYKELSGDFVALATEVVECGSSG